MLTTAIVKAARPRAAPYKMHDHGGLHLIVRPTGTKTFRMKFRRGGKEQLLTLGSWPELQLTEARQRRDQAREALDRGEIPIAPGNMHNSMQFMHSDFEALARAWHESRKGRWSTEHAIDALASLERDVFPAIGARDPRHITAQQILDLLQLVEDRGCIETARRLRERISGVFRFGIVRHVCSADPAMIMAAELAPRPVQVKHPALTEVDQLQQLIVDVEATAETRLLALASRLLALTAVRPGTLRGARWDEFDGNVWHIPAARMKLTKVRKADPDADHIVVLSRQAMAVLDALRDLARESLKRQGKEETEPTGLLFPGRRRDRPIGETALSALYREAGYAGRHVPHGWRAAFSTVMNARFKDDRAMIDRCLAHASHKGKVEAAYNRAQLLDVVGDLFQRWADILLPDVSGETAP